MSLPFPSISDFIQASPIAFHTAAYCEKILREHGFTVLDERHGGWQLLPGGKYCIRRGGSSIAAFALPENFRASGEGGLRILLAHTDSPALKVKVNSVNWAAGCKLPVEVYGSPILSTWLDRPLKVAVRAASYRDGRVEEQPFTVTGGTAVIPNPAIHLADLNSGFKYNPQHHLAAIISASLRDELAAICRSSDAVEMWLCDGQAPVCDDAPDGLIQAPRLDNLASCHAALKALCSADTAGLKHIPAVALFDLEECGDNFHSARGTLLDTMFESIRENLNLSRSGFSAVAARSWIISCDAAHGFHPNFPELYDAAYAPVPGSGIALKTNANQRYATTVAGEAFFNSICSAAGIRSQRFAVRSDMRCGSTLGPGCAMRTGIPTVDIGIPLLAMHSIRETASLNDLDALTAFCAAALNG